MGPNIPGLFGEFMSRPQTLSVKEQLRTSWCVPGRKRAKAEDVDTRSSHICPDTWGSETFSSSLWVGIN